MIFRHERDGVLWIDLERPTPEEVQEAAKACGVGSRIADELISPSPSPLILSDSGAAFLTLHLPIRKESDADSNEQELDLVVGKNFVLTASYEVVTPIHQLRKIVETSSALGGVEFSPDALTELLFNHLFGSVRDYANNVATRLERVEHAMFSGNERVTVRPISEMNREFLHLEAAVVNQEEYITLFLQELDRRKLFGNDFRERVERILAGRSHLARLLATHRAVTTELRETNNALLSSAQNEVMKTLTVITFIMLPLALVANVFEMTLPGVPFSDNPHAFWIVISIMFAVSGTLLLIFTRKRWL